MNKSLDGINLVKETKAIGKANRQSKMHMVGTVVGRLIFGLASLTTSIFAFFAAKGIDVTMAKSPRMAVYVSIAITLVPAAYATGKYIIGGLTSDVRKGE